jgi:uncharacterized protein (DUF302 family)
MSDYGYSVEVPEGYDEAVVRARLALRGEGFSILTEMDVGGVVGPEAGDDRQYLFMGAWGSSAVQAIDPDVRVGLHLPCNVVVQETPAGAVVAALDPAEESDEGATLPAEVALEARNALGRVLRRVAAIPG